MIPYSRGMVLLPLLFIALIFASCSRQGAKNPEDTMIRGNFKFIRSGKIMLLGFSDSLDRFTAHKKVLDTANIMPDGSFSFTIHPLSASIYELKLKDTLLITDLYLEPKQELILHFNEKYQDPRIDSSTDAGRYNDYRVKLNRKFYFEKDVKQVYYIVANYMTVAQFDTFCHERKRDITTFYNHYFKDQKPGAVFENYALSEINYQYGIDKLMYLWKKRIKNMDVFPDSAYYDFAAKTNLENPKAMMSPAYYHFLSLYINNIYGEMVVKNQFAHQENRPEPDHPPVEKFRLACQKLQRPYRDIVLFNIIKQDLSTEELKALPVHSLDQLINAFKKKYPELKGVVL